MAEFVRAGISLPSVRIAEPDLPWRALELAELTRLHLVDAYLVASAEVRDRAIASFDRGLDRLTTIRRVEPS